MISNSIARVDPYAIKEMEFSIKKSKKYTTFKSLIASLIVLVLTIAISYDSLSNLWKGRSELPVSLLTKYADPNYNLTSSPVCFQNSDFNSSTIPRVFALNSFNESIPVVDRNLIASLYPYMIPYLNTSAYECIDLKGQYVRQKIMGIIMSTDIPTIAFVKGISQEEVIIGANPPIINVSLALKQPGYQLLYFNTEKYTLKDQLAVDYDPEELVGLAFKGHLLSLDPFSSHNRSLGYGLGIIDLAAHYYGDNIKEFTIVRQNIGQILGKFFAWYSLFLILFVVIFGPVVDFTLNLQLAKTLYTHDLLNGIQPSLFVQTKFYLATCFARCLPERIIHTAFDKLNQDTDLLNLLRKQLMMRKISKQLRYGQNQVQLFVPDFQEDQNKDKELLQKQDKTPSDSDEETESGQTKKESDFDVENEQRPTFFLFSWLDRLLCSLDFSEVEVGLVYNKGNPHGSIWSIIVVLLGAGGLLMFLILTGVISIQVDSAFETEIISEADVMNITYTIAQNELAFYLKQSFPLPFSNQSFFFQVVNHKHQVLENITMLKGIKCKQVMESLNETYVADTLCLPKNLTLYYAGKDNETFLKITTVEYSKLLPIFLAPLSKFYSREVRFFNQSYRFINKTIPNNQINYLATSLGRVRLQVFKYDNQINQTYDSGLSISGKTSTDVVNPEHGLIYRIEPRVQRIKIASSTIWDVIDNTWGMVMLSFEIIVFKIAKLINRMIKSSKTRSERQIERSNVVNILANHDRLIHGSFRNELNAVKYYFKENLSVSEG